MASIVITGFMATGKSSVGREVARRLGWRFVDTDALVEQHAGRSVAEIFATDGEGTFRALERAAVAEACAGGDTVIATGGGALMDPDNRARLAAAGPIVCLTATPEAILQRVGDAESRPLLAGLGRTERLARIRALLTDRAPLYAVATHTVDTTDLDVDDIAARVAALAETRP